MSHLEHTQSQMDESEVNARLEPRMADRFRAVSDLAKQRCLNMRDAAMYLAIKSVASALLANGRLP